MTSRLVRVVALTGLPAHASLLTMTMNAMVPAHTSRFDHRCDNALSFAPEYAAPVLALVFLCGINRQRQGRLVVVAVERSGLHRVDAHELAVLDLQTDQ